MQGSHKSRIAQISPYYKQAASLNASKQSLNQSGKIDNTLSSFRSIYLRDNLAVKNNQRPTRTFNRMLPSIPIENMSLNSTLNSSANTTMNFNNSIRRNTIQTPKHEETKFNIVSPRSAMNSSRGSLIQDPVAHFEQMKLPMNPATAVQTYGKWMTNYEQTECMEYTDIYCLGLKAKKQSLSQAGSNYGFDDDRSDYKLTTHDHVAYRYEILQVLGKGSFGQVIKAFDHKRKEYIALKILRNQRRFHRQGRVEIKVLKFILENDRSDSGNMVKMLNYFIFRSHICISFQLLSVNLYDMLKSNRFQGFSISLIRRFAVQLLQCLHFLRESNIIHCDLKPENILLVQQNKAKIKVIDFGSACFEKDRLYTYIQSRFYRAPEIMLGIPYTPAIDMWSLGCILVELAMGYPLFPGESEADQLQCIMEIKGVPPASVMRKATRKNLFFNENNQPKITPNSNGKKRYPGTRTLQDKMRCNDTVFLDFISSNLYTDCLEWDPDIRWTPEIAMRHEWICANSAEPERSARKIKSSHSSRQYL